MFPTLTHSCAMCDIRYKGLSLATFDMTLFRALLWDAAITYLVMRAVANVWQNIRWKLLPKPVAQPELEVSTMTMTLGPIADEVDVSQEVRYRFAGFSFQ